MKVLAINTTTIKEGDTVTLGAVRLTLLRKDMNACDMGMTLIWEVEKTTEKQEKTDG